MKTFPEYLADSERLAEEDKPKEALHAHISASFAYEEETDPPRDYDFYLVLGDRYTAAGYFEHLDDCYDKALRLARGDPLAEARVLAESSASSLALERRLDQVMPSLDTAELHLRDLDDSDEVTVLRARVSDLKDVFRDVLSRTSSDLWAYEIAL